MTSNQKIETSKEIRQWIKMGLSVLSIAAIVNPEGVKNGARTIKDKTSETIKNLTKK